MQRSSKRAKGAAMCLTSLLLQASASTMLRGVGLSYLQPDERQGMADTFLRSAAPCHHSPYRTIIFQGCAAMLRRSLTTCPECMSAITGITLTFNYLSRPTKRAGPVFALPRQNLQLLLSHHQTNDWFARRVLATPLADPVVMIFVLHDDDMV